jgi:hypothetical protein
MAARRLFRGGAMLQVPERGSKWQARILWGVTVGLFCLVCSPPSALAIPAFARKYDLSCTACHTKPPRLNAFGEAFHMAGFQIPGVQEGETKKKRSIGRIWSELDFLNIFAVRANGDLVESVQGGDPHETSLTFPTEAAIYLAGTLTDEISYFFELEQETRAVKGIGGGLFEEKSEFGIGKEFFLLVNLQPGLKWLVTSKETMPERAHDAGGMGTVMVMGPMVMIGKIDPSTNFSYPTNRQYILNIQGHVESGLVTRFGLTPFAFASKFFGIKTATGDSVEVTKSALYNTSGGYGVDFHLMIANVLIEAGLLQGLQSGINDANQKKDPYLMMRLNFGQRAYTSGSLSGLVYWGNGTAMVDSSPVDWLRYGVSGNLKYKYLDLYGAVIWDAISHLPAGISSPFDRTAYGVTVEGDYLAADRWLLSLRYDRLGAGGFVNQKADGQTITAQARFYLRDNIAFYLRDSYNLESVNANALRNFRNAVALGVDVDF